VSLLEGAPLSYLDGKMEDRTRLTSKGQIVIPKRVREQLRWRKGTRLRVRESGGEVILSPLARSREELQRLLDRISAPSAGPDPIAGLEADHRAEIEADERWLRKHR
jgi:AbrB family looped-hinge helix DNA binding protein